METSKFKRIIIIIIFLLIVGVIGYFIWSLFFRGTGTILNPTQPVGTTTPITGLPEANQGSGQISTSTGPTQIPESGTSTPVGPKPGGVSQGQSLTGNIAPIKKVTVVNDAPSMNPIMASDGRSINFYDQTDGKFYKLNENGDRVPLSDKTFYNVSSVEWAPNTTKAIIEYPDKSKIVYDFETNKQATLPKHWEGFNFSTDSNKLVMKSIGVDPDNRWLITSNADGSNARSLEFIGANADTVYPSWSPNNQSVALYTEGEDFNRQKVYFVGLNGENFKGTTIEGRGLQSKWSESGDRLLYSVYNSNNDLKPKLWVVDAQGDSIGSNRRSLEIETFAEKCTFANNKEVYCAVPNNLDKAAGLFPDLAKNSEDTLYRIDVETGLKKQIAVPDGKFSMSNLMINSKDDKLYFTDQNTNKIYKVDLK